MDRHLKPKKWWTLENPAKIFPATSGAKDERVFRLACNLKEKVQGEKLQAALDSCMEEYPSFLCVMRGGLFWNYMEESYLHPIVREEYKEPCSQLYVRDQKNLLFEVTYFENRINFETYHALTDGNGALQFVRSLVYFYLMEAHPETVQGPVEQVLSGATADEMMEDSFHKYFEAEKAEETEEIPSYKSHQLKYRRLEYGGIRLEEGVVSVKEVLDAAHKYHTTVTVYLTAVFLCALAKDLSPNQKKRAVSLMIPVNLRNYFPSETMRNFFWWIDLGYDFSKQSNRLEDVIAFTAEFFENELKKERVVARVYNLLRMERNPFARVLPLKVKEWGMQMGAKLQTDAHTALLSNIGRITMPKECEAYIDWFDFYTCTPKIEICICSYQDKMCLGLSSAFEDRRVEKNFYEMLKGEGIEAKMISWDPDVAAGRIAKKGRKKNDMPMPENQENFPNLQTEIRKYYLGFRIFTFLCVAMAVIGVMMNSLTGFGSFWSKYVLAGAGCMWLLTAMAIRKRRNLLKNAVWMMWLFWAAFVLWDGITGWMGWSFDYAIPIMWLVTAFVVLCAVKIEKLQVSYYMVYLMLISISCIVPAGLLFFGIAGFRPLCSISVACGILILCAMAIFRSRELFDEFHKKMHL